MMRSRSSQLGFSAVEIAIVVAVIVIIGFLGYTFYNNYLHKQAQVGESSKTSDVDDAPVITTTKDLDKANSTLDDSDLESNSKDDLSEMDKDLSAF
jgi:uncharacterized membrane protein YebE (DUF533 family)